MWVAAGRHRWSPVISACRRACHANGLSGQTAQFARQFDLNGNVVSTTFPSGTSVTADHSYGVPTQYTVFDINGGETFVNPTLDPRGWGSGYTSPTGPDLVLERESSTVVSSATWQTGGDPTRLTWEWDLSGTLLESKVFSEEPSKALDVTAVTYAYDVLNRVESVRHTARNAPVGPFDTESYIYDPAGNLVTAACRLG